MNEGKEGSARGGNQNKKGVMKVIYLIISLGISYVSYQFGWIKGYEDRRQDIESNPFK